MIAKQLFCMGILFLLLDVNCYNKRNSRNPVNLPDRFLRSFRFLTTFCFGLSFLQAIVIYPYFPNWTISVSCLCSFAVFFGLRMGADWLAGPLCFQCRRAKEFLPFLILVGLTFFLMEIINMESSTIHPFSDPVVSVFLMLFFLLSIGRTQVGFHQNGVHFGYFFITWENVRYWKWKDRRPNYLIFSTNLFLFPFAIMMLAADQREEARRLLEDALPDKERINEPSLIESDESQRSQSGKFFKSIFFSDRG